MSRKKRRQQKKDFPSTPVGRILPKQADLDGNSWKFSLAALIVICVLGSILYSNTFDVPFVFDDENNISNNRKIRVSEFDLGQFYEAAMKSRAPRPVAFLSFALNYYFGSYDLAGYHLVNLMIHLINGVLVYFLASYTYRLFWGGNCGKLDPSNQQTVGWLSLFAACLFVAHPLQTQAVTYVVQRMTSLSVLFFLWSFLLYIQGRLSQTKRSQRLYWAGALVTGILAMGSKQIAITLPVVILLYEWYFIRDLDKQWAKRGLKYLVVLVVALGAVSLIFLGTSPWQHLIESYEIRDFTMGERVLTQFRVVLLYLGLVLVPLPSRLNLNHHIATSQSLFDPATTFFSMLAIAGLVGLGIYLARRQRLMSFCILWFFLNLVLESSVVALEMIYEHRVYLPMFGVVLLVPYLLHQLFAKLPKLELVVAVLLVLSLGRGTYLRNEVWSDASALWADVIAKNPQSNRAYDSSGNLRWKTGQFDQAIADFSKSIELKPDYAESYNNRANCYSELKKYDLALEDYAKAIHYDPEYVTAYANRGSVYGETGKYDLAILDYAKAIEIEPDYAPAYYNRSLVYSLMGDYESAVADISIAIEQNPSEPSLLAKRASYYRKLKNHQAAIADYTKVVELNSDMTPALVQLAWLLATASDAADRNGKQAIEYAQKACELTKHKNAASTEALAAAYAETGNFPEAVQWQAKAIELAAPPQRPAARRRLELYLRKQPFRQ